MISRREFLATAAALGGTALVHAEAPPGWPTRSRRLGRVGIQLYSVRGAMRADDAGTLARLAEIGYREVEYAGYFGRSPTDVRAMLAANHLSAPSTHIAYELIHSGWDKALDDALAIGHETVTVPSLPQDLRRPEHWRRVADEFSAAGERARARGLGFAYHNHNVEFEQVGDTTLLDTLLEHTRPEHVMFELDVYWMVRAGRSPVEYIRRHPERFTMLHMKDSSGPPRYDMVDVGAGTIDFAAILRQDAELRSAVRHVFVEHDEPADPLGFAKRSYDFLSKLEY